MTAYVAHCAVCELVLSEDGGPCQQHPSAATFMRMVAADKPPRSFADEHHARLEAERIDTARIRGTWSSRSNVGYQLALYDEVDRLRARNRKLVEAARKLIVLGALDTQCLITESGLRAAIEEDGNGK